MHRLLLFDCIVLSTVHVLGDTDANCFDNCKCCIDEVCHTAFDWPNVCTLGCIDGHRSARCYELCLYENCKSCGTGTSSKECDACYDSFYLGANKDCIGKCPVNCNSCTSSTICNECKEGYYNKEGSTTCEYGICPLNCECVADRRDCINCQPGYFDTRTFCTRSCPVNCVSCVSTELCSACKNGFYNGYEYDNTVSLPLNNCTVKCRQTCAKCQSYNKCSQCVNGKYGLTCQDSCSDGCVNGSCLIESGHCNCSKNFTGNKCTECVYGKYGNFCNLTCSENCNTALRVNESYCTQSNGSCLYGCKNGYYGATCNVNCSSSCLGNVCTQDTGTCVYGCVKEQEGPGCLVSSDVEDKGRSATVVILGTLLALALITIVVLGLLLVRHKRNDSRRNTRRQLDVTFENQQAATGVTISGTRQKETNTSTATATVYETIHKANEDEHTYQQM